MSGMLFFNNRDNAEIVQLLEDGIAIDLAAVTKVSVKFKGVFYDSTANPTAFDWTIGSGRMILQLGKIATIPAGSDNAAEITIYDPTHPNGIVWGTIRIKITDLDV